MGKVEIGYFCSLISKDFFFQSYTKSSCYGSFQFAETKNGKSRNWLFLQSHFGYLNVVLHKL